MEACEVQKTVEDNYKLHVKFIEKIKNVYKIQTKEKNYCLKIIKYDFSHFLFIISAIKHLQNSGFKYIPEIIKTNKGMEHINLENNYAYLTYWIDSRQCNYDSDVDMIIAASKLAELHKKSTGFQVTEDMRPRVGWFKWIQTFKTRRDEIVSFKKIIEKKQDSTKFDSIYLSIMNEEIERAEKSIENLVKSNYIESMNEEIVNKGFCHHDFANHNVLISKNSEINIIDFDYCMLDTHLHDLASLLLRCMKNGKWEIKNALFILDAYNVINKIKRDDIPIMASFMEFPQDYWQLGIQYYWENQPWGEEIFLKRLKKFTGDRYKKQKFVDKFRFEKYN